MEFISAKEFLKQPIEVQKVFIDWWKPSIGNLINKVVYIHGIKYNKVGCLDYEWWHSIQDCDDIDIYNSEEVKQFVFDYIGDFPLLTEGQLRQFIEDKTGNKVDCCLDANTYDINICEDNGFYIKKYEDIDSDLLQAYWKVATQIAKEA